MTRREAEKLMALHKAGYIVQFFGRHVDSPASNIYEKDGEIVFSSEVYLTSDVERWDRWSVRVSKPVENWSSIQIEAIAQ